MNKLSNLSMSASVIVIILIAILIVVLQIDLQVLHHAIHIITSIATYAIGVLTINPLDKDKK